MTTNMKENSDNEDDDEDSDKVNVKCKKMKNSCPLEIAELKLRIKKNSERLEATIKVKNAAKRNKGKAAREKFKVILGSEFFFLLK